MNTRSDLGLTAALFRYPVKSMIGEELHAADLSIDGLRGDRAFALRDPTNGKVVSAKNPRKWGRIFEFRAAYAESPQAGAKMPPVRITLPGGDIVTSEREDLDEILTQALGRDVTFATSAPEAPTLEEYWPDMDGLAHRDMVTDEALPPGTFCDLAAVHLLTTATIDRLRELYPQGRFEVRRFRPNIVVRTAAPGTFAEDAWVGRTVAVGDEVRLKITKRCARCVMTTLPQGDLPGDAGILRAAAEYNEACAGVYAAVLRGGTIRRGDVLRLE